ncbi:hypothetical protein CKO09_04390 [Chromatium weissei]|nr:hypothetical protein [Chromatium weissei]
MLPITGNRSVTAFAQTTTTNSHHTLLVNRSNAAPAQNTGAGSDLAAELAAQLEQDLDYQILRKSFDLESKTSLNVHRAQTQAAAAQADAVTAHQNAVMLNLRNTNASAANTTSSVALAQTHSSSTSRFALVFEVRQQQSVEVRMQVTNNAEIFTADPLVLNLSDAGITTTGVDDGVQFDLNADGVTEQVSMVSGETWLLALDRNHNGRIDDGGELFGDQHGAANGFAELARYDADANGVANGVIDADDVAFSELQLLQIDGDGQQVTQTLEEAGVVAIELAHQNTRKALNLYDTVSQTAQFHRDDGSSGEAADVLLGYRSIA